MGGNYPWVVITLPAIAMHLQRMWNTIQLELLCHSWLFTHCNSKTNVSLQAFAVPGSAFFATLCGILFPAPVALLLVSCVIFVINISQRRWVLRAASSCLSIMHRVFWKSTRQRDYRNGVTRWNRIIPISCGICWLHALLLPFPTGS